MECLLHILFLKEVFKPHFLVLFSRFCFLANYTSITTFVALMRKAVNNKTFLLVAGLLIGLVTLFSHSLRLEIRSEDPQSGKSKETTEQTVIIAPSDAVTVNAFSFHADSLFEIAPVFQSIEKIVEGTPVIIRKTTSYFHTLFRFIISPNAP
jgi:hypothetical protein